MYINAGLLFIVLLMALGPKLGLTEPDIDAEYRSAYFGCYEDNKSCGLFCRERILLKSTEEDSMSMTVKYCIGKCKGYTYAGVVYRNECFCGNEIKTDFEKKPEAHCYMPCSGDRRVICGGSGHISIYEVPKYATTTPARTSSTIRRSTSTVNITNRPIQSTSKTLPSSQATVPRATMIKTTEPTKLDSIPVTPMSSPTLTSNGLITTTQVDLYRSETAPPNGTGIPPTFNTTVKINHTNTETYNIARDDTQHENVDRDQPSSSQNASTTMIALFSVIGFLVLLILGSGTINVVLFRRINSSRRNTATPCSTKEQEHSSDVATNQAYNADMDNHRTCVTDYEMLGEKSLNDHIYERPEQSENTKDVSHT